MNGEDDNLNLYREHYNNDPKKGTKSDFFSVINKIHL